MAEINTFSAACDAVVQDTGRAEVRTIERIKRYVRQTIRECNVLEFFHRDITEAVVVAQIANATWEKPDGFRMLRTVKYPIARYLQEFPPMLLPGKIQREQVFYYYGAQTYIVFAGIQTSDEIKLAYYTYPRSYVYYAVDVRPAKYDDTTQLWSFLEPGGGYLDENNTTLSQEQQDAAIAEVSNWLLFDWYGTIIEGGSAKTYKNLSDPRAPASFALYKSFQKDLRMGEPHESLGM